MNQHEEDRMIHSPHINRPAVATGEEGGGRRGRRSGWFGLKGRGSISFMIPSLPRLGSCFVILVAERPLCVPGNGFDSFHASAVVP